MTAAAKHLTPVTLELGGKNPVFVAKDADIELAAKRCVWGRMMNAGQQCISPDYVLCEREVLDKLIDRMKFWIKELYGSNPKDNGNLGKIVGDRQMTRIVNDVLKNSNGEFVCGGRYSESDRYIEPSILKIPSLSTSSRAMDEETFGPILIVIPIDSIPEAIRYVNSRPKSLSLYLFSNSRSTQEKIIYNTSAGGVTVNGTLFHCAHPGLPFGGVGASGCGAYHGDLTFHTFSHNKPVLRKCIWNFDFGLLSDPFFVYPPWTEFKEKLVRFLMKFV